MAFNKILITLRFGLVVISRKVFKMAGIIAFCQMTLLLRKEKGFNTVYQKAHTNRTTGSKW